MKESKIIYTGGFRFPNGDAASQRVLNNAKILKEQGYTVEFISWGGKPRDEDKKEDGFYYYQGFKYQNTGEIDNGAKLNIIGKVDGFLRRGKNTLSIIAKIINTTGIIIAYNPPAYFTTKLLSLCKKNGVVYISDITEWYSSAELPGGKFAPPYWISEYNMRTVQKKVENKILISSFLNRYFSESNNVILPPLVDINDIKWKDNKVILPIFKGLRIVYAGTPGKKDRLDLILQAVLSCLKEGRNIQFVVVGVSKGDLFNYRCYQELDSWSANILLLGAVPQENVPLYYKASDFSILVREDNRKNRAGFPTKLAESLTAGCPAIVNYTSDISEYVKNEVNGIIISDFTTHQVKLALDKATALDKDTIVRMKENAKSSAVERFDYNSYKEPLSSFLNKERH